MKKKTPKRKPKFVINAETREDFDMYYNGPKMHGALWDLAQALRQERKYGRHSNLYSSIEREFYKILEDNGVELG